MKKRYLIFGLLIFCFFLSLLTIFFKRNNSTETIQSIKNNFSQPSPIPTPFAFQDVTIPYLRQRSYNSKLGNLEKNYENTQYTAYLTSYDSDGLKINGLLTQPTTAKPADGWPAIIFLHGYIPPRSYQTVQQYYSYVDYLARNGFVVFKIDLRGHGNSEGEASGAYYSADYVIDVLNAYSALQNSSFVNPDAIGLWGHSMAGNVVMRSFAARPEIPAVVIWAGAVYTYEDMQEFGINDSSYQPPGQTSERVRRRQLLRDTHGDPDLEHFFWKLMAPTNYLNDLKGAIEIHHAVNDNVVTIDYSRNLMNLLDATSITHQLHEYQSGGHNLTGNTFNQAMQKTVEFYEKNLR